MSRRIGLLLMLCLLAPTPVLAQFVAAKPSQEAMMLDLDSAVTKRLASVEDFLAEKQWDAVATLLRQTQAEKSDKLVAIGPGWYISVGRFCQCQGAMLPAPALAAYRRQVDATAKRWLDDAGRISTADPSRQRAAWLRIVRQAFASSAADEALDRLAEQSFEAADFAVARTYWEQLLPAGNSLRSAAGLGLPRHPSASCDAAQVRAQLILCSLFGGDVPRARREFEAFRKSHGDATGSLAGREGPLVEVLANLLNSRVADESPSPAALDLDQSVWSVELPSGSSKGTSDIVPIVVGSTLFASNGESVFAFDSATGRPKWSDATELVADPRAAVIHTLADPLAPRLSVVGQMRHSLMVVGDRLYARLGTPITGRAKQETRSHSELVGLDVGTGEGKLVWRVTAAEIDSQDPLNESSPWCFEGTPVADARRVITVLRRSLPQEQINVACFDADSARLLWNRKLGVTVVSTEEAENSVSHLRAMLAEDSVIVSTDAGAIAALDAHDGAVRWVRTYASQTLQGSRDEGREGDSSPIYHNGVLFVAPLDTNLLLAIHAESGLLLWQHEWPDPIEHLLGVADGTLIAQGRSLWGISPETGLPAWPHRRVGHDDPEGSSFGKGILVDDDIWWPNRDELVVVNAASGRLCQRRTLHESLGLTGGSLVPFGTSMTVTQGSRLTVLGAAR